MADALLQTLTIKLNAEVGNTKKKLNDVATSVEKLEEIGKKADWSVFEQIRTNLEGIAKIDFSNVADSLRDVVSAMKALGITSKKVNKMKTPTLKSPTPATGVKEEGKWDVPNLDKNIYNYEKIIQGAIANLKDVGVAFKTTVQNFEPVVEGIGQVGNEFTLVNEETSDYAVTLQGIPSITSTATTSLASLGVSTRNAGNEAENSSKQWLKLINSIKRITFYRMVRRAIQLIGQIIRTSIEELAQYNDKFGETINNIKGSFQDVGRGVLAVIAPILTRLEPVITSLLNTITNGLYEIGYAMSKLFDTQDFSKEIQEAKKYAEELKKIKNIALGIDELNIIQDTDKTAESDKEHLDAQEESAENAKAEEKWYEKILRTLRETFSSVDGFLAGVFRVLTQIWDIIEHTITFVSNIALEYVDIISAVFKEITSLLDVFINIFQGKWDNAGKAVVNTLSSIVNALLVIIFGVINGCIDVLNTMTSGLSVLWTWAGIPEIPDIPHIPVPQIPLFEYATGGFPEDGFFLANHNELVGQFSNGKTVVANNEQIVEGIKRGVYEAMINANNGNGDSGKEIVIQIDGTEIARAVNKHNEKLGGGADLFRGGTEYGY